MKRQLAHILVFLGLTASAAAFDLKDSRAGGLGRGVLLSYPTAANLADLYGDGLPRGAAQFDAGYNRRFELADLDYLFIAGARQYRQFTVAAGASQFGKTDLYAEQLLKGSVAFHYRDWTFGVSPSAMQIQIGNDYGTLRAATIGLGAAFRAPSFRAGLVADNLTGPRFLDNSDRIQPTYTLLTEYCGQRAFSLVGRLRAEPRQKPQYGLGQWISLSKQATFFWGVATAPMEYGGGIEIDIPFGSVTYAATIHPVLGMTHTVTLSYRSWQRKHAGEEGFD